MIEGLFQTKEESQKFMKPHRKKSLKLNGLDSGTFSRLDPGDTKGQEGIWYIIKDAGEWKLFGYPFWRGGRIENHCELWEQTLAPYLATQHRLPRRLKSELLLHPYGFPRGRVTKLGDVFNIYHGNDWEPFPAREKVAEAFHLPDTANWVFDEHETRNDWDMACIRNILNIEDIK